MRAVAQRVVHATVRVGDERVAEMATGLLALVGVAGDDTTDDAETLAAKLVELRVFDDDQGRMNRSLLDCSGQLGVVPQFTLLGDARKGRRPSYARAASPEVAEPLIEALVAAARARGADVVCGRFRTTMEVSLQNSGPVTILLDTRREF